ncbi:unnamed protein product [Calypogeia fissa]
MKTEAEDKRDRHAAKELRVLRKECQEARDASQAKEARIAKEVETLSKKVSKVLHIVSREEARRWCEERKEEQVVAAKNGECSGLTYNSVEEELIREFGGLGVRKQENARDEAIQNWATIQ